MEQEQKKYLGFPHLLLCNKQRYNQKELTAMDLPDDFFDNRYPDMDKFSSKDAFPDLNATWQRATWPTADFMIDWSCYEGM